MSCVLFHDLLRKVRRLFDAHYGGRLYLNFPKVVTRVIAKFECVVLHGYIEFCEEFVSVLPRRRISMILGNGYTLCLISLLLSS